MDGKQYGDYGAQRVVPWDQQLMEYQLLANFASQFPFAHITFVCFGCERLWKMTHYHGAWDEKAAQALNILRTSGQPIIDPTVPLLAGQFKGLHFDGSYESSKAVGLTVSRATNIQRFIAVLAKAEDAYLRAPEGVVVGTKPQTPIATTPRASGGVVAPAAAASEPVRASETGHTAVAKQEPLEPALAQAADPLIRAPGPPTIKAIFAELQDRADPMATLLPPPSTIAPHLGRWDPTVEEVFRHTALNEDDDDSDLERGTAATQ